MSFWKKSTGESVKQSKVFDGGIRLIPDNTFAIAIIKKIEWAEYEGQRYINAQWTIADGEYKNISVFQKLHIYAGGNKGDRALTMLSAIDANCGGALFASQNEPSNVELSTLTNKPIKIKIKIWRMDDGREGNWIESVMPADFETKDALPINEDDIPF